MKRVVKLNEFFSACIQLVEGSDVIIHNVRKEANFAGMAMAKGEDMKDVFTEADVHIQNTVVHNLKELYPRAKIIGEEDEYVDQVCTKPPYILPDQLSTMHISQKMLMQNYEMQRYGYRTYLQEMEQIYGMATPEADYNYYEFPDEFFEEDMVIWIDPLDGTKGFTEGHLNHITSMIGVAINGRPRIGIIHKPFYKQTLRQGRTYFGTPECGIFIKDKFPRQLRRLQRVTSLCPFPTEDAIENKDYDMWVVGSMNTNQQSMNEIHHALDPQHVARVAGAGNKIVHMLDQKADFYINLVPGFKYWDLCAGEALLQSMMGVVCDASNKPLVYDETAEDFTIQEGIVISKNKKVFDIAQERLFDATGNDLMYYQQRTQHEVAEYRRQKEVRLAAAQEAKKAQALQSA